MEANSMKTTLTAVALVLALGTSAYAQDAAKPATTPAAPAAAATPAVKPVEPAAKPVIAPEAMQKVGGPVAAPVTAPKVDAKPATTAAPAATTAPAATKTAAPAAVKQLNINTGTVGDLAKLPKLDEARAKQIVAGRPYKSIDELVAKKVLTQEAFDAVKGLVTVK